MCMESVYVVGRCNVVAHEGMFLVGCCSWLQSILECFIRKSWHFNCYSAVFIRAYTACTKHCCVCSDEDCRIAVETSAFSNKAFSWNKGYFVTNVVAVEHGRYSLSCMQKLWASAGSAWYVRSLSYVVKFYCCWMRQNLVWMVFYVQGCGVSSAEYRVHLVSV